MEKAKANVNVINYLIKPLNKNHQAHYLTPKTGINNIHRLILFRKHIKVWCSIIK